MAIEFKQTKFSGRTPEFWRGECKVLPGGFKPTKELPQGSVLFRGTPIRIDFAKMTAEICKGAKVMLGSSATKIKVAKGHLFVVGDKIAKVGAEDTAVAITAIDTKNPEYDVLTHASLTTEAGTDYITLENAKAPNAVVAADLEFNGMGLPTIDAAYDAVVLYPSLPFEILPAWLNDGLCMKSNPNIMFIKQ